MRLAITFLILSLFVPISLSMVSDMDEEIKNNSAADEIDKIISSSKKAYHAGAGSSMVIEVSLASGYSAVIGGEGSDAYSIMILKGDKETERLHLERPSVKFIGDPIYIAGQRTLSIDCVNDGEYGVKVRIID